MVDYRSGLSPTKQSDHQNINQKNQPMVHDFQNQVVPDVFFHGMIE
jgi:hypothetical protein